MMQFARLAHARGIRPRVVPRGLPTEEAMALIWLDRRPAHPASGWLSRSFARWP